MQAPLGGVQGQAAYGRRFASGPVCCSLGDHRAEHDPERLGYAIGVRAVACPRCGKDVVLGEDDRLQKRALCLGCDTPFDLTVDIFRPKTDTALLIAQPTYPATVRREVVEGGEKLILEPSEVGLVALRNNWLWLATVIVVGVVGRVAPDFKDAPFFLFASVLVACTAYVTYRAKEEIEFRGAKLRLRLFRKHVQLDVADVERVTLVDGPRRPRLQIERKSGAPLLVSQRRDKVTLEFIREWLQRRLPAKT
jgi:hypothetical protein